MTSVPDNLTSPTGTLGSILRWGGRAGILGSILMFVTWHAKSCDCAFTVCPHSDGGLLVAAPLGLARHFFPDGGWALTAGAWIALTWGLVQPPPGSRAARERAACNHQRQPLVMAGPTHPHPRASETPRVWWTLWRHPRVGGAHQPKV